MELCKYIVTLLAIVACVVAMARCQQEADKGSSVVRICSNIWNLEAKLACFEAINKEVN